MDVKFFKVVKNDDDTVSERQKAENDPLGTFFLAKKQ